MRKNVNPAWVLLLCVLPFTTILHMNISCRTCLEQQDVYIIYSKVLVEQWNIQVPPLHPLCCEGGMSSSLILLILLRDPVQSPNGSEGIFQLLISGGLEQRGISAICRAFVTTWECAPQCWSQKPLSMCFHMWRTRCEFSPWPHLYYGHWTLAGFCRVAEGIRGIQDLQLCLQQLH